MSDDKRYPPSQRRRDEARTRGEVAVSPALLKDAKTLKASGTAPYSIGGAEGWTLTDLFENIYLRTFGQAKYNTLSAHKIKWTDPSVNSMVAPPGCSLLNPLAE